MERFWPEQKRRRRFGESIFGKKNKAAADKELFASLMAELAELRDAVTKLIGAYERVVSERDGLKRELAGYKTSEKEGNYEKRDETVSGTAVPERS